MQIIKSYLSNIEIDEIVNEIDRLISLNNDSIWIYNESNIDKISRIEHFVDTSHLLTKLAIRLCPGNNYKLMKDKINFKYPGGAGFNPHQDITAGWGKYADHHISIAIPLQDTFVENGCIYFSNIPCNTILTPVFTDLSNDIVPDDSYSPCPTTKGDCIIFDSFIPHKSYTNNTSEYRLVLFFTFALSDDNDIYKKYHNDKFSNNPPDKYKKEGVCYRSGNSFTSTEYIPKEI